ncbi:MAG TPA: C40 family peptidase [Chitinophagaceae bacterium]|nr:C40 family peptidase [Chitinophagaceae bacterium]
MVKRVLPALVVVLLLSSCTVFKTLDFSGNKQTPVIAAPVTVPGSASSARFIEDITVVPQQENDKTEVRVESKIEATSQNLASVQNFATKEEAKQVIDMMPVHNTGIEAASTIQLKYSVLLNTEVEYLPSKSLLEAVDEFYGVRYRKGGNNEKGIDCSGFTCAVYTTAYGFALPRVSKEQYRISRKISTTELQEGDLLFFNTVGRGVSHVGVYLGNNKFIHATVSKGVMVNSLFEPYYIKRFLGAGRIDDKQIAATN